MAVHYGAPKLDQREFLLHEDVSETMGVFVGHGLWKILSNNPNALYVAYLPEAEFQGKWHVNIE